MDKTKLEIENFTVFLTKLASASKGILKVEDLTKFKDAYLKTLEAKVKPTVTERQPASLTLKKSITGYMVHDPTNIVFVKSSQYGDVAVGFEDEGELKPLTMKQCILCSQNAWKYNLKSCIKSASTTSQSDCAVNLDDSEFTFPSSF